MHTRYISLNTCKLNWPTKNASAFYYQNMKSVYPRRSRVQNRRHGKEDKSDEKNRKGFSSIVSRKTRVASDGSRDTGGPRLQALRSHVLGEVFRIPKHMCACRNETTITTSDLRGTRLDDRWSFVVGRDVRVGRTWTGLIGSRDFLFLFFFFLLIKLFPLPAARSCRITCPGADGNRAVHVDGHETSLSPAGR